MPCRVVIADDVDAVRALFRHVLEAHERIEVVAEAADGREAVEAVLEHRPDVLVTDLAMPVMDGLQALVELRERRVDTRVVVLTGFARDRLGPVVLEAGADAYLEKGATREVICRTVLEACEAPT